MSILDSPDRLLVIFDCGQSRQNIAKRSEFAARGVSQILNEIDITEQPLVRAVCLSNSFTNPGHDGFRDYENMDWKVFESASSEFPFMFGDYAAMNRMRRANTFVPPDFRASVVLPLEKSWLVYRHPNSNDRTGWIEGAKAILADERSRPLPQTWGSSLIQQAAGGDINGIDSARFWHGVKVNIHLHRQLGYQPDYIDSAPYEDDL